MPFLLIEIFLITRSKCVRASARWIHDVVCTLLLAESLDGLTQKRTIFRYLLDFEQNFRSIFGLRKKKCPICQWWIFAVKSTKYFCTLCGLTFYFFEKALKWTYGMIFHCLSFIKQKIEITEYWLIDRTKGRQEIDMQWSTVCAWYLIYFISTRYLVFTLALHPYSVFTKYVIFVF